jgi:hypothetical protein
MTLKKAFIVSSFLIAPFCSEGRSPSFTGMYAGGDIGYRNFSATINQNTTTGTVQQQYKFTGAGGVFDAIFGVGKAWKNLYLGYEFNTGFNTGKSTKTGASLGNSWQFGLAARIGAPMNDAGVMPYFGFGFEYRQMTFKTSTTNNFYNYSLAPTLGSEFILDDNWRFRGEIAYQMNIKTTNLPAAYNFKSRPNSFVFKGGIIYKISND